MSTPDGPRADSTPRPWDAPASEETQVLPPGGYRPATGGIANSDPGETQVVRPQSAGIAATPPPIADPSAPAESPSLVKPDSAPLPPEAFPHASRPATGDLDATTYLSRPVESGEPTGGWGAPAYSAADAAPPATSLYPPTTPPYAPAGYPQAYVPVAAVPAAPASAAPGPVTTGSRVLAGFVSAILGLLLVGGGGFLLARYGWRVYSEMLQTNASPRIADVVLALAGAVLILIAVILNGWSPWATIIPGIALTGLGAWGFVTMSGLRKLNDWSNHVLNHGEFTQWTASGWAVGLGLVLIGASIAAIMARAAGKRSVPQIVS
jgi:hypothetical protein